MAAEAEAQQLAEVVAAAAVVVQVAAEVQQLAAAAAVQVAVVEVAVAEAEAGDALEAVVAKSPPVEGRSESSHSARSE